MPQKLSADGFEWKKSNFDEKFIKNCDKSIKGYILKIDIKYLNNLPGY